MELLVVVGNLVCWGAVVAAWIILAIRGRLSSPGQASGRHGQTPTLISLAALVAAALVAVVPQNFLADHLFLDSPLVRGAGLGVLAVSTLLALWARGTLGAMWSIGPRVAGGGRLRTGGPYAVTRHPIYTGLLGMLIGSAALGGLGRWLVLPAIGLIVFGAKIRDEERLLISVFPEEYAAYRRRVPSIVPAPSRWLRGRSGSEGP